MSKDTWDRLSHLLFDPAPRTNPPEPIEPWKIIELDRLARIRKEIERQKNERAGLPHD
jgi:hypothetical protein